MPHNDHAHHRPTTNRTDLSDRCWVLRTDRGAPPSGDGDWHYISEAAAARGADDFLFGTDLRPEQLPAVCIVVTCRSCPEILGSDEHDVAHWTTGRDAAKAATSAGWTAVGAGWACPDHSRAADRPALPGPGQRVLL